MLQLSHNDYKVGWICALPKEQTAAMVMLDERHADLPKPSGDPNTYTLGSIGVHNIAIACLPKGKYGTISATMVATNMTNTFPAIRFGLMVGIGGGVPPSVRLGDVVVSLPADQHPGVVQWDLGKAEQSGSFRRTGALSNPPTSLLTALTKLESEHEIHGSKVPQHLNALARKYPRLAAKYTRSNSLKDILFEDGYAHVGQKDGEEQENSCQSCDLSRSVTREPRDLVVHYGLIASGNQVIKNAAIRETLVRALGGKVLCFEMEAAGLMDNFPCLVIRGICDYADSHKNKVWQEYAAAVAAAFAKELLNIVPVSEIAGERPVKDILTQIDQTVTAIGESVMATRQQLIKAEVTEALEWLSPNDYGSEQTDTLKRWHRETGNWFLCSREYQSWLQNKGRTLYSTGIPGAGKTVMSAAVIHDISRRFPTNTNVGLAYVYFMFSRHREQTFEHVLASLLMQFLRGKYSLPESILFLFDDHRMKGTRLSHEELSTALISVISGYERAFIVLDALDECTMEGQSRSKVMTEIMNLQKETGVNILATSRENDEIASRFRRQDSTLILPISAQEVDVCIVLHAQMEIEDPDLFDSRFRQVVSSKVAHATKGMFLLAQLHLNALFMLHSKGTITRALEGLSNGPSELHAIYERTMRRIESQEHGKGKLTKSILLWVVLARRPLSALELQHALSIETGTEGIVDDDLPSIKTLKSVCAGLVTIDEESGMVRLIHYTAQEYFRQTREIWFRDAQLQITHTCLTYLSLPSLGGCCKNGQEFEERLRAHPFLEYAANEWGYHARESSAQQTLIDFLQKRESVRASHQALFAIPIRATDPEGPFIPERMNGLHLAAFFGLHNAARALLSIDMRDADEKNTYGQTPLSLAAENGHVEMVKLLLNIKGVDVDSVDTCRQTPLLLAARNGQVEVVKLILSFEEVDVNSTDICSETPLLSAARNGHVEVVRLLLSVNEVDADCTDQWQETPLSLAVRHGHSDMVSLLQNL